MLDENQTVEDIEEITLVENQELEQDTPEEVSETKQDLSDSILDILLGEAKKNEEEEKEEEAEEEADLEEGLLSKIKDKLNPKKAKAREALGKMAKEKEKLEMERLDFVGAAKAANRTAAKQDDEQDAEDLRDEAKFEMENAGEVQEKIDELSKKMAEISKKFKVRAPKVESVEEEEEASEDEEDEVELPENTTKAGILAASFDALKGMKKSQLVSAYKAVNMTEGEEEIEVPKLKADIINDMYGQLKSMKKEDLTASYKTIKASSYNESTEESALALDDDLSVLVDAEQNLTEDFKSKAAILFEGALANRVASIKEELEEQYNADLKEEVEYIREKLVTKIDDYLAYVVETWIEENQEFVDSKLRTEITENFMTALQGVFTEHYIEVPEEKRNLVDELSEGLSSANESLADAQLNNHILSKELITLQKEKIISEASSDLASTEVAKLTSMLEEVEFTDADTFAAKVAIIKESFFSNSEKEIVEAETSTKTQTVVEGAGDPNAKLSSDMKRYLSALSRFKD